MDIQLDISLMAAGRDGVRNFLWPVAREEMVSVRDSLSRKLVSVIKDYSKTHFEEANVLSILELALINESMSLYLPQAIHSRLESLGHHVQPPRTGRVFSSLITGKSLDMIAMSPKELYGLHSQRWNWLNPSIRRAYRRVRRSGISVDSLVPINPKKDIIALQETPIIKMHAGSVASKVQIESSYSAGWFRPESYPEVSKALRSSINDNFISDSLDAIGDAFLDGNETISDGFRYYLKSWLQYTTGLIRLRLNKLTARHQKLPDNLWTGSGAKISTRILQYATRIAGGKVIAHDHSQGQGFLIYSSRNLTDYDSCSQFVTYNEANADALRKYTVNRELLVSDDLPKIVPVPRNSNATPIPILDGISDIEVAPRRPRIKTIMYPASFYNGERIHYAIRVPDMVQLDWESRLFTHLDHWGYKVIHKPYPGSIGLPTPEIVKSLGGETSNKPFEQVMHRADLVIFIDPKSTPLVYALAAGKPVVFIDAGLVNWVPEALDEFSRRCSVVRGYFDEENRLQVDWDDLKLAIEKSTQLSDESFYNTYFTM